MAARFLYVLTMPPKGPIAFQDAFFSRHPGAHSVMELFEGLPNVAFYAKDTESRFVRVNQAFLLAHGLAEEAQILGLSDRDFHAPAFAEAYIAEDGRVMAGRRAIPGQLWMVLHFDKQPHWYISTKVPLFDAGGAVIGIAGAMYSIQETGEKARYFQELQSAIRHMETHYSEPISMAAMARLAGLSSTHFNRRFQQLLRSTPTDYLRGVRIQAACGLLSRTQRPLAEVAVESGFADQSHFTRCFQKCTGLTPRAYRQRFLKT